MTGGDLLEGSGFFGLTQRISAIRLVVKWLRLSNVAAGRRLNSMDIATERIETHWEEGYRMMDSIMGNVQFCYGVSNSELHISESDLLGVPFQSLR